MKTILDTFPSTLPPGFVKKVLATLLPDPSTIPDGQHAIEWLRLKTRYERHIRDNPLRYFSPNEGGQREFLECEDPAIQGIYYLAGNKSGKTTAAIIKCIERASGKPVWGGERRAHLKWKTPTMGAIFCEDFDTHRTDILPRFFTWCPREELAQDPLEFANGEPARIIMKNGSPIYLRTYQQGYLKHEGKDYDWVFCNEPFSRDIYTAIWRGFTATAGIMLIAATLLSQVWLYDEMAQSFIKVIGGSMLDNPWLDKRSTENYIASMTEEEKQVRVFGRPSHLSGVVYPEFKDKFPHVVANFEQADPENPFPWNIITGKPWPIVIGCDPHERKPVYLEWAYISPLNEILWFDWAMLGPCGLDELFRQIDRIERSHHHASVMVVMDPNRGRAIQLGGSSWIEQFEAHDYPVQLGDDNVSVGHATVREMLMGESPRMRWTEHCRGQNGPLFQMQRYIWQDWKKGEFQERDKKEQVADIHKDFPDVHRYVAMARLDYHLLLGENAGIITLNGRRSQTNPYTRQRESAVPDFTAYRRN